MTIKEFRLAQGLSQAKLAKSLGIGVSTIGNYEAGRIKPSENVIGKIKEVFGVDLTAPTEAAKSANSPKKPLRSKAAAPAKEKAAAPAKAPRKRKETAPAVEKNQETAVIIQSPLGGEITAEEILAKTGPVDRIYVRVDQNAAYWVKGEDSGAVNLW